MNKVWLPQEPWGKIDLTTAAQHGTVTPLVQRSTNVATDFRKVLRDLETRLQEWTPDDYFAAVPCDALACVLLGAVMERMCITDKFNWLRYDRAVTGEGVRKVGVGYFIQSVVEFPPDAEAEVEER